jgi:CRP/FNR family transcriptional regulator, cyclic AMP receptor protein
VCPLVLSPSQKRELLSRQDLFRKLSDRELDDLVQAVQLRRVGAKEELWHKGDPGNQLYLIVDGVLKAQTTSASGDDIVFSIMGPSEMFGELALLRGGKRTATVIAIRDSQLIVIDRRELFPFLRRHPDAALKVLEVLAARVERLTAKVEDKTFLNLPQRLAKCLFELAARWGRKTADGVRIEQRLNQSELGDLVATSRESINKQIKSWRKEGVVAMADGYLTILDEKALKRISEREDRNLGRPAGSRNPRRAV